jgi:hypothetical protein
VAGIDNDAEAADIKEKLATAQAELSAVSASAQQFVRELNSMHPVPASTESIDALICTLEMLGDAANQLPVGWMNQLFRQPAK